MKHIYTFGECLRCKKIEALKNGYCVECSKFLTMNGDNPFSDIFGGIFGVDLFGKDKEEKK